MIDESKVKCKQCDWGMCGIKNKLKVENNVSQLKILYDMAWCGTEFLCSLKVFYETIYDIAYL